MTKTVEYKVKIRTGHSSFDKSWGKIYMKLVGEDGESKRTRLHGAASFFGGKETTLTVRCSKPLGKLVLIELEKMKHYLLPERPWFVDRVEVTSPEGEFYTFPIYNWINDEEIHLFREGKALVVGLDQSLIGKYSRDKELHERRKQYCSMMRCPSWEEYAPGLPHCIKADDISQLPCEVRFSFTKSTEFLLTAAEGVIEMNLDHLADCKDDWKSIDAFTKVFHCHRTPVSEFVQKKWKDDAFFGYQFLNGLNPMLIRCCSSLPTNLQVSENMSLQGAGSLGQEMQEGNIFICDYKNLDGVKANIIHGKVQHLMAPLVLFHKTPEGELKPIAIQLGQAPAEDNPVFLPTDSEYDWLLAKTFVRSSNFSEHELNIHLLRTHLLAEVYTVSLLRNLPRVHPLYKLLIPHTRYTLEINLLARKFLISKEGAFTMYASSGGEGVTTILQRSTSTLTYRSLCLPEDIADRGLQTVPNFYYRDDGLLLWDVIHKFVYGILSFYYNNDKEVEQDQELQTWINDIFERGFLSNASSGVPQFFHALPELVKFVTMVIFTCSAQHAAVNNGQFEYGSWMPNSPGSLQQPPPREKGSATEATLLKTLPDVSTTVHVMAILYLLSKQSTDFVALGHYTEEYFSEETPRRQIKEFQTELEKLHTCIEKRNKNLELPYVYLDPNGMENSVAI